MKLNKFFFLKLKSNEKLNIILAGGKSPLNYYKLISEKKIRWQNVNFFLLDERIISTKNNISNYKNIKKCFKKNSLAYKKINPLSKNVFNSRVSKNIIKKIKKIKTVAIIGMGNDGHFASIFFKAQNFKSLINIKKKPSYQLIEKIGTPKFNRISMNLSMILLADYIIVYLNKKKIIKFYEYLKSKKKIYPISYLVKHAKKKLFLCDGKNLSKLNDISLQN